MEENVGGRDLTMRLVTGGLLLLAAVAGYAGIVRLAVGPLPQALTSFSVGAVALILLGTAITRRCYVNKLLGRDTTE